MATKRSSRPTKSRKNGARRIPSVKRLERVRPLQMSMVNCDSDRCGPTTRPPD